MVWKIVDTDKLIEHVNGDELRLHGEESDQFNDPDEKG